MTKEEIANNQRNNQGGDAADDVMEHNLVRKVEKVCRLQNRFLICIFKTFVSIYLINNDDSEDIDDKNYEMEEEE